MSTIPGPEREEVETTRAEKLLAIGLVAFLLVGGFWVMDRLGDIPARPDYPAVAESEDLPALENAYQEQAAGYQRAVELAIQERQALEQAKAEYEFRREEYRVALEKGLDDAALAAAHDKAKALYETADARWQLAEAARAKLESDMSVLADDYKEAARRVSEAFDRHNDRYQFIVFVLRFAYALPLFGLSVWLWLRARRLRSRPLILATAFMAFAGLEALGLIGQYGWYLLRDVGQIAVSIVGSTVCLAGLLAIQRWASNPRRVAMARLRRRQCPGCGFPLTPGAGHCAGCGRRLVSPCPSCGRESLSDTPYCSHCGASRD